MPTQEALVEAIASSLYSRIVHSLPSLPDYTKVEMASPFQAYHEELIQSDRDPKTIARYWQIIKSYQTWLDDREPGIDTVKQFIAYLRSKKYRPSSILLYYHALRLFHDFIGQPFKLKLRKEKILPPYYTIGDIESLIHQAEKGLRGQKEWQKQRNKTLILTLAYTGMRKSELLGLQVGDIDFNRHVILIRQGKGRRDRAIPMAERLVVPLREQCANKQAQLKVFDGLNARSVYRVVNSLAKACRLEAFHPHSLRHFFATALVERGANLKAIQELLGHESLETTSVYLDVSAKHLEDAVALLNTPLRLVATPD